MSSSGPRFVTLAGQASGQNITLGTLSVPDGFIGQIVPTSDSNGTVGLPNRRFESVDSLVFAAREDSGSTFPMGELTPTQIGFGSGGEVIDLTIARDIDANLQVNVSGGAQFLMNGDINISTGGDHDLLLGAWSDTLSMRDGEISFQAASLNDGNGEEVKTGLRIFTDSDADKASDTTLFLDSILYVNIPARRRYKYKFQAFINNSGSGGIKVAIGGSATIFSLLAQVKIYDGTTKTLVEFARLTGMNGTGVGFDVSIGESLVEIEGYVEINSSGTFGLSWAQNTVDFASTTLQASSTIVIERVS